MKASYGAYSIPRVATLWCGVSEEGVEIILGEATQVFSEGFGSILRYLISNQKGELWQSLLMNRQVTVKNCET